MPFDAFDGLGLILDLLASWRLYVCLGLAAIPATIAWHTMPAGIARNIVCGVFIIGGIIGAIRWEKRATEHEESRRF